MNSPASCRSIRSRPALNGRSNGSWNRPTCRNTSPISTMSDLDKKYIDLVACVRELYGAEGFIPLHAPRFDGNEKRYLLDCVDSTFVSSVGAYVDRFEAMMRELTG